MDRPMWLKREALARCGRCGERQPVAVAAVGYQCRSCGTDWRWSVCATCDRMDVVPVQASAVECPGCGTLRVAWWQAADSEIFAGVVGERRQIEDARRRRARRAAVIILAMALAAALLVAWIWSMRN